MDNITDAQLIDEMLDSAKKLNDVKGMVEKEDLQGAQAALVEMSKNESCGVCSELISRLSEQVDKTIGLCKDANCKASDYKEINDSVEDTRQLFTEAAELVNAEEN